MATQLLVIDIGTSSVRAAVVDAHGVVTHEHVRTTLPDTPAPGLVEFDAPALSDAALDAARTTLAAAGLKGRKVNDLLIASVAIRLSVPVMHYDRDFAHIASVEPSFAHEWLTPPPT